MLKPASKRYSRFYSDASNAELCDAFELLVCCHPAYKRFQCSTGA